MATSRAGAPLGAYVLHTWDWSESSLILDLFTRSQGRLVAVAKGAKKPTSGFRPVLLPFHALTVWLARPGTEDAELRSLRAVEWAGSAPLPGAVLMSAFYLNELLLKGLARQDPHPALHDAYADTLSVLARAGADEGSALRAFELVLLRDLGVLPALDLVTLTAQPVQAGLGHVLRGETGLAPSDAGVGGVAGARWVEIAAALAHRDATGALEPLRHACRAAGPGLRPMLRALVHYHLGTTQLRTRQVGLELQRLAESPPK